MSQAGNLRIRLDGYDATLRLFERYASRATANTGLAMYRVAQMIFDRSQYYVPVSELGSHGQPPETLKNSARIRVVGAADSPSGFIEYRISYEAFYAAYVHERLDQAHKPPTQAKFLEQASSDMWPEMTRVLTETFHVDYGAFVNRQDLGRDVTQFVPPVEREEG